ncbi:PAS domain S-box protein [Desulforhopalus vacuolatus]|uniref:LuxR C-terminal-related transcriptional regulator n=1 Tax=Desulforhopalus vacuolatus TaxID=40414 RepID=UPI0019631F18|nr:LuxR C-terminal-related transcriptional regulator [Desulforhopalus vacuolatus]MBM9520235.1 PAS domain S-box protein [Desulforhopalus vacuolatus]
MELKNAEKIIWETQQYAKTILNSLSAHIAIIDKDGMILETNVAWRQFASCNEIGMRPDTLNVNYLKICDAATGDSSDKSGEVAAGIRSVIKGDISEFVIDYPCHAPGMQHWFYMRVTRAVGDGPLRVVISHEDITALKIAEEQLKQKEDQLREKTQHLEEANVALRAVIRKNDEDAREMEQAILQNIRDSILPGIKRLQERSEAPEVRKLALRIESDLQDIASPFLRLLSNISSILTPQEMKIALLIREGKTSKEIANFLNLSEPTISFHRQNLRTKLGLTGTSSNLRTYLLTLEK